MRTLRSSVGHLQALRRKFEALLEAAREKGTRFGQPVARPKTRLREVTAFGGNPGNLRMLMHVPEQLPPMAPLVVALHGCNQTADEYDYGTGWSSVADRLGFTVVYPEQQPANNPKNCFSWFVPGHISRGHGEALSIQQMVEHAVATFDANPRRVFVTGLSAGGAMAAVMLATYPDFFAGGAIIAGLPYGCARSVQQAFEAMFREQSHSAQRLGDHVRKASSYAGPWPKISVWHGTADPIVKPSNAEDIVRQWISVHGLSSAPSFEELIGIHKRRVWNDANGHALIEAFSVTGMAHGVPLASATTEDSCGTAGAFFLEAGISSTHRIADFWCLDEDIIAASRLAAMDESRVEGRAVVLDGEVVDEAAFAANAAPPSPSFEPNVVLAEALKRFPFPKLPVAAAARATPHVPPGPIIEAALKAAGLVRS